MTQANRYLKIVEWSEEDQCYIGSCSELFYGGCHGADEGSVFDELCGIVEENIQIYAASGKPLPAPMSGKDFVNAMPGV